MILDAGTGTLAAIFAMSGVTIFLRLSGFFLMRFIPMGPRLENGFRSLPGAVAAATFAPLVMSDGASAAVAILIAVILSRMGRNDLVALIAGVSVAVLMRQGGF